MKSYEISKVSRIYCLVTTHCKNTIYLFFFSINKDYKVYDFFLLGYPVCTSCGFVMFWLHMSQMSHTVCNLIKMR